VKTFNDQTKIYENWVHTKYVVNDINVKDIRGEYDFTIADKKYKWKNI
jgi:hypothetical protein